MPATRRAFLETAPPDRLSACEGLPGGSHSAGARPEGKGRKPVVIDPTPIEAAEDSLVSRLPGITFGNPRLGGYPC